MGLGIGSVGTDPSRRSRACADTMRRRSDEIPGSPAAWRWTPVPPRHKPSRCHKRKPMRRTERKVQVAVSTAVVSDDLYKRQPSLRAAEPTNTAADAGARRGMNVPGFVRSVVGLRFSVG